MGISIKVDEDLPRSIADLLREAGHNACTVVDQGLGGTPDAKLWDIVQNEGRLLMTADLGFSDARRFPPGSHAGVILLRLHEESREAYRQLVHALLAAQALDRLTGTITVVTPDRIRTRRP